MRTTLKSILRLQRLSILAVLATVLTATVGCATQGESGSPANVETGDSSRAALKVASTVSPITSLAENIGGDRIRLTGIVPEGTNSHTFEPAPSVAAILAEADLFIANGLFLEEPTIRMAEANQKEGAVHLILGPKTITEEEWVFDFSFPQDEGHPNPHLWTAPHLALRYAQHIRDELVRLDADNAAYYEENFDALAASINDLDRRVMAATETIPPVNRKLLTYHDSFPYFGPRYGFEIIGAIQPSDFTEPSAREVASLIDQVRESEVPAIFGSEVFPSPVMQQIAREGGAEFVDELRDDDLPGGPGDPEHTYMGLILEDVRIIVNALEGDPSPLEGYDPGHVFEGESGAVYPQ
ncbi:MAG: metal ABC transporter substrate-binding protein [Chloroflexi bacterium]|nr:metal ABC transporter substrate-binding protein [Chloroflexota bacterium]